MPKKNKFKDFIEREYAQSEFMELRSKLNQQTSYGDQRIFIEKTKKDAVEGDPVAQDFLAYLYKEGYERIVPESFSKQLRWEILAGANGNEFAINKLQFYFGYAFDQIVYDDNFELICYKLKIDQYNYVNILGKALCAELVKFMGIDAKALNDEKDVFSPYRPEIFRDFRRNLDEILPKLIEGWKK